MTKKTKMIIIIAVIVLVLGLLVYKAYHYVYYESFGNYFLEDENTTPENVQKYLENHLYEKYHETFSLTLNEITKEDFCGGIWGCLGVYIVKDIYNYKYDVVDKNGITFKITYRNSYRNGGVHNDPYINLSCYESNYKNICENKYNEL